MRAGLSARRRTTINWRDLDARRFNGEKKDDYNMAGSGCARVKRRDEG